MQSTATPSALWNKHTALFFAFIVLLGYMTYFHNYWNPPAVFWDENYHIASAQKYLNGVYFMEQHPPLGKLLIAAGEKIFHPNAQNNQYIGTDYATNFPQGFSFAGYRFFSAFLGWWTAPVIFFIFLLITRNSLFAAFLSFFYVFDNALIVHIRGAMLEGTLEFFSAAMILVFLLLLEYRHHRGWFFYGLSLLFGVIFGCIMTTKLLGLVFVLLVPAFVWTIRHDWQKILKFLAVFGAGFLVVYISVWQIHFALGKKIVSTLPDNGYYQASPEYKDILVKGTSASLASFPVMLRDSLKFVTHYNSGAPRLDLCKPDENGSPPYMWPLGARTINYRWETPDGKSYMYLYLQSNPVVWLVTFAAVLVAAALLVSSVLAPPRTPLKNRYLLATFLAIYVGFFVAVTMITRVLYLYHYFIPLLVGFVIVGLIFVELQRIGSWVITEYAKTIGLMLLAALIFIAYQYYRPLTYYQPITDAQFQRRAILPVWELSCVHCQKVNGVAIPRTCAQ